MRSGRLGGTTSVAVADTVPGHLSVAPIDSLRLGNVPPRSSCLHHSPDMGFGGSPTPSVPSRPTGQRITRLSACRPSQDPHLQSSGTHGAPTASEVDEHAKGVSAARARCQWVTCLSCVAGVGAAASNLGWRSKSNRVSQGEQT